MNPTTVESTLKSLAVSWSPAQYLRPSLNFSSKISIILQNISLDFSLSSSVASGPLKYGIMSSGLAKSWNTSKTQSLSYCTHGSAEWYPASYARAFRIACDWLYVLPSFSYHGTPPNVGLAAFNSGQAATPFCPGFSSSNCLPACLSRSLM